MSQICVYSVASIFHKFSSKNLTKLSIYPTIQRLYSTNLRLIPPCYVHKSESISNNSASVFNKPASASKMCDVVKPEPDAWAAWHRGLSDKWGRETVCSQNVKPDPVHGGSHSDTPSAPMTEAGGEGSSTRRIKSLTRSTRFDVLKQTEWLVRAFCTLDNRLSAWAGGWLSNDVTHSLFTIRSTSGVTVNPPRHKSFVLVSRPLVYFNVKCPESGKS